VTSVSGPEHAIYLWPLENATPGQLRRCLGREAWRKNPVASLRYEPHGDRIMVRLIDAPSMAFGFFSSEHPPDPGDDLFIGFDGVDSDAWLTIIAVLDVGRHNQSSNPLEIVRELLGNDVWEAALALRGRTGREREITISPDEAARLVSRWGDRVVSLDETRPSDEAFGAVLAEWSTEEMTPAMTQNRDGAATGQPVSPDSRGYVYGSAMALADAQADAMSPVRFSWRGSGGDGQATGRRPGANGANGAGATSTGMSSAFLDDKPPKALPYGPLARLSDIWAAWRDGRAEVPPLPADGDRLDPADTRLGITPYMEIRNRHFLDRAERERRRMLIETEGPSRTRAEVHQNVMGAEERARVARKFLDSMPNDPPDLVRRNVLEQHAHEALIRARRIREFNDERLKMLKMEQDAIREASALRAEEAELSERIAAREQIVGSRVRQLHHHALRRCGTYIRHIVHHHPDGSAVIPYLEMARPTLPDWIQGPHPAGDQANGPDGPAAP
jgi:hypothetical protein